MVKFAKMSILIMLLVTLFGGAIYGVNLKVREANYQAFERQNTFFGNNLF